MTLPLPSLPALNSTDWYSYMGDVHDAVNGSVQQTDFQEALESSVRVVATSPKVVNNSTTFSSDTELSFAVTAGDAWQIDAFPLFTLATGGGATTDVKLQWSLPAGSTGWWQSTRIGWDQPGAAGTSTGLLTDINSAVQCALAEGTQGITLRAIMQITTTGTATLQWAQNTAAAVDLTRLAYSNMMCERLTA